MSVYGGGLLEQYSIKISFDIIGKPKLLASEAMIVPFSKNEFWYMVPSIRASLSGPEAVKQPQTITLLLLKFSSSQL